MTKVYDTATDLIAFARLQSQNTTSGSSYLGSDGLLKFAAEDEPRIEYGSDGSLKGLLIEEQRTNLVTYSEDFSQSYWTKQAAGTGSTPVVAASSLTDPAGGTGAYEVAFDVGAGTTSGDRSLLVSSATATTTGVDYTHSIWVRGDVGGEQIVVRGMGNSSFDLFTLTTGWTRISATETANTTAGNFIIGIRQFVQGTLNSTATIHIYGAQLEAGSFATSYIPTSGSQQTRSADVASIPVSAFGYNQSAGTLVVEAQTVANQASVRRVLSFDDGASNSDSIQIAVLSGGTTIYLEARDELTLQVSGTTGAVSSAAPFRVAYAYAANDYAASVDGGALFTDTTASVPTEMTQLGIGSYVSASSTLNGHIKSIQYYPRRLTDAQLQELTA